MEKPDFSDIRRELRYQDFMIHYLQEEQKKRQKELDSLWQRLEKLQEMKGDLERLESDPKFKNLIKLTKKRRPK